MPPWPCVFNLLLVHSVPLMVACAVLFFVCVLFSLSGARLNNVLMVAVFCLLRPAPSASKILLVPEDEGIAGLLNMGNHSLNHSASHPRRLESSENISDL